MNWIFPPQSIKYPNVMRAGGAEGDPERDGRRTLVNGWESRLWRLESGRQALERGEFRQAVWEATSIKDPP